MTAIKYFLAITLLFVGYCLADSSEASVYNYVNSGKSFSGYNPNGANFGVSNRNQTLAVATQVASLILSVVTLIVFFIARRNAKSNYKKAKKLFIIGLGLFCLVVIFFFLPKLFLSTQFPGNFDIRAT